MTARPEIFDRSLLLKRQQRASNLGSEGDFLRHHIAEGIAERLMEVNREFHNILDHGGNWSQHTSPMGASALTIQTSEHRAQQLSCPDAVRVVPQDEELLPYGEASFDLILSNLVMHFINDLPGTLFQINRALKPDGLFIGTLFGGNTLYELRDCLIRAEAEITGGASPRIIPFGDIRDLGSLLQRAGFKLPVADSETVSVTYDHPIKLMQDLRAMGETNILMDRSRKFLRRDVLMRACDLYLERYQDEDGRIKASFEIIYLTGWHEHESQQKPLKPGAGKVSLADALKGRIEPK